MVLENGLLKVTMMTWFGGRIIGLESKLDGVNLLDSPYESRPDTIKGPEDIGGIWGELTDKILIWTFENMLDSKGYFYFRKGPLLTNKIPYMRWTQAWMFHALTEYQLHRRGE